MVGAGCGAVVVKPSHRLQGSSSWVPGGQLPEARRLQTTEQKRAGKARSGQATTASDTPVFHRGKWHWLSLTLVRHGTPYLKVLLLRNP